MAPTPTLDISVSRPGLAERAGAGLVAASAWSGICLQTLATQAVTDNAMITAFAMARYFTILTNLAYALVLTCLAAGRRPPAGWLGGATLCILTVGVVYALLLRGFAVLPGLGPVANLFLHQITPILAGLFWLGLAPKGQLRPAHAVVWLSILFAYGGYALLRGVLDGAAVYPFLDPQRGGWGAVLLTMFVLGVVFTLASLAMIVLDQRMALWARIHRKY